MKHSYKLDSISYEKSHENLLSVEAWLNSKGIVTENTRFKKIKENVKAIHESLVGHSLGSLITEKGNEELWFSLLEATPFESIYEAFKQLKDHEIPKRKLTDILSGPFLPKEEESGTSNVNNRNYLFELELASKLKSKGINITGFDDIKFEFESVDFTIECKRIFSDRTVRANIEKAYEQLQKQMATDEQKRGIIALSIEKIFQIDHLYFEATKAETETRINQYIDSFRKDNRQYWEKIIDIRVIGIFIILKFIVIIEPQHILTHGFQLAVVPLCSPAHLQYRDYDMLMALGNKLANNA
ncbi:MAG: hypothetical protein HZA11_04500 [Nitrospirae bacterium]|nr:hypothetical protein [Nitrospirota bacterium]